MWSQLFFRFSKCNNSAHYATTCWKCSFIFKFSRLELQVLSFQSAESVWILWKQFWRTGNKLFSINFLFGIWHSNRNFCNFVDCNLQQNHNCQLMDGVRCCLSSLRIILYTFDLNKKLFHTQRSLWCQGQIHGLFKMFPTLIKSVQQTGPTHFTTKLPRFITIYQDLPRFKMVYHDMWEH